MTKTGTCPITGTCHCGGVEFTIPFDGEFVSAKRCDCSLCRRRWAVMASVKLDDLKIVKGEELLTLYRWNTGEAKHYFCKKCGIYTFHKRRADPTTYGVNIACFDIVDIHAFMDAKISDGINHICDRK